MVPDRDHNARVYIIFPGSENHKEISNVKRNKKFFKLHFKMIWKYNLEI